MTHEKRGPPRRNRKTPDTVRTAVPRGKTCEMCGGTEGNADPYRPSLKVRVALGRVRRKSRGGSDVASELRLLCTTCRAGTQNILLPARPTLSEVLSSIRRATIDDQRYALDWLVGKFGSRKNS